MTFIGNKNRSFFGPGLLIIVSIVYFHKTIFSAVLLRRAVHVQTVSSRFVNGKFQPLKKKNFM